MSRLAQDCWYRRVLIEAVESLQKRPEARRGPYRITDAHLRNVRAALASHRQENEGHG